MDVSKAAAAGALRRKHHAIFIHRTDYSLDKFH